MVLLQLRGMCLQLMTVYRLSLRHPPHLTIDWRSFLYQYSVHAVLVLCIPFVRIGQTDYVVHLLLVYLELSDSSLCSHFLNISSIKVISSFLLYLYI